MDLRGLGGSVEKLVLSPGFSPKHQKNGRTDGGREGGEKRRKGERLEDRNEGKRASRGFPALRGLTQPLM